MNNNEKYKQKKTQNMDKPDSQIKLNNKSMKVINETASVTRQDIKLPKK